MASQSLKSMSVAALLKLRDDISTVLSQRAAAVKQELRSLREDYAHVGRIAVYGKKHAAKRRLEMGRATRTSRKTAETPAKTKKASKNTAAKTTTKQVSKRKPPSAKTKARTRKRRSAPRK